MPAKRAQPTARNIATFPETDQSVCDSTASTRPTTTNAQPAAAKEAVIGFDPASSQRRGVDRGLLMA